MASTSSDWRLPLLRLIARLPRGGFPLVKAIGPGEVLLPTEVGPVHCDLRESVCFPLLRFGTYPHAREEFDWLRTAVTADDIVFDIGANIGFTAKLFAATGARVLAFEPSPRAFRLLQKTAGAECELWNVAVTDKPGTLYFREADRLDRSMVWESGIEVRAITIDELPVRPTFIKIDVEGHEPAVIRGAAETLRNGPRIFFEALSDEALAECSAEIVKANANYRIRRIGSENNFLAEVVGA